MKLYTVGPCEMFDSTKELGACQIPYFRNQDFSNEVLACERLLKHFAHATEDDNLILLTSSGTGAMEAVVMNCLTKHDKALVIDGGTFGRRFSELCSAHEIPHENLTLEFGAALTPERLAPYAGKGYTALLVNLDETSTGQLYDGAMLGEFCRLNNMLYIVDAISAFGSDHVDMQQWGVSALVISSQKALSLPPGLSLVLLDHNVFENRVANNKVQSMYFDFKLYAENGKRGQTPFTPAVGTVLQLRDILEKIADDGGIKTWIERSRNLALDFRRRIASLPVRVPSYPLANAVTPLIFEQHDAQTVQEALVRDYGMYLNPCGGKRVSSMLRVAHIGNLSIEDNKRLVDALEATLSKY